MNDFDYWTSLNFLVTKGISTGAGGTAIFDIFQCFKIEGIRPSLMILDSLYTVI